MGRESNFVRNNYLSINVSYVKSRELIMNSCVYRDTLITDSFYGIV